MGTTQKNRSRQRYGGVVIVEFIIVLPICLMLMMATAEFARAFLQYNALTKAVQDGARHVAANAIQGSTGVVSVTGALQTQAQNLVVYGNTVGAGSPRLPGLVAGNVAAVNAGAGNITVTATYPYGSIFVFVPEFFYGGGVNVSAYTFQAAVTMRAL